MDWMALLFNPYVTNSSMTLWVNEIINLKYLYVRKTWHTICLALPDEPYVMNMRRIIDLRKLYSRKNMAWNLFCTPKWIVCNETWHMVCLALPDDPYVMIKIFEQPNITYGLFSTPRWTVCHDQDIRTIFYISLPRMIHHPA